MWIAPSYVNQAEVVEFRYGLYAGKTYEKNDILPFQELAIPMVDFFVQFNKNKPLGDDVIQFLEAYVWEQEKIGSQWEGKIGSPALIPGIGILSTFHSSYSNTEFLEAALLLREQGPEFPEAGEASLLRGAVTPYFNATLRATQKIPSGMEIFMGASTE